jgi:hypothetical protein
MNNFSTKKDWRFMVLGAVAVGLIVVQTVFLTVSLARLEAALHKRGSVYTLVGDCPGGGGTNC